MIAVPEPPLWEQWAAERAAMPPDRRDGERLQKVLATSGWGSRRVAEDLIGAGRVTVNGEVAILGRRVDPENDLIEVDGAPVGARADLVYYLLNKRAGVVTTARDTHGRPTVLDDLPRRAAGVPGRPPRRRDRGPAARDERRRAGQPHRPSVERRRQGVPRRRSRRRASGVPPRAIRTLREGVELDDGMTVPRRGRPSRTPGVLRITIHEGRNRQIRRMCEAVGHPVIRLVRTRIGPITDRKLKPGEWRELTPDEVRELAVATAHAADTVSGPRPGHGSGTAAEHDDS